MIGKLLVISVTLSALSVWGCSAGSDTATVANSEKPDVNKPGMITDPGATPGATLAETNRNSNVQTGSFAERSGRKRNVLTTGTLPPPQYTGAPEDSTITTSMKPDGQVYEIRVFKSHPQLARVEATWTGPTDKSLRIFLRNGTVREVPSAPIQNLRSATAAEILALAGIVPENNKSRPGAKVP